MRFRTILHRLYHNSRRLRSNLSSRQGSYVYDWLESVCYSKEHTYSLYRSINKSQKYSVTESIKRELGASAIAPTFNDTTSAIETIVYLKNTILKDTDAVSMHNGVEIRVPFLDNRVHYVSTNIPSRFKQRGGGIKPLLRAAFSDLFPHENDSQYKRKQGFELPFEVITSLVRLSRVQPADLGNIWSHRYQNALRMYLNNSRCWHGLYQIRLLCRWLEIHPNVNI